MPHSLCSRSLALVLLLLAPATAWAGDAKPAPTPATKLDWPAFLARHDLVWRRLPDKWEEGAFLGNGLMGAMAYGVQKNVLGWELGRADVTEHRPTGHPMRARGRLPIGQLQLETAGDITAHEARLDLWNAELTGTLTTAQGKLRYRSFLHAQEPVLVVELEPAGGAVSARLGFRPDRPLLDRIIVRKEPMTPEDLHPAPFVEEQGPVRVSVQRRTDAGEFAVAWQEKALGGGRRLLVLSIADSFPGAGARKAAADAVRRAIAEGPDRLRKSHRAYWHAYYPASFVSLPDTRLESFYWLQMYKLASATRADGAAIDTMGPWYHRTPWPGFWWNLNVQLTYWPVYAANRLALGESLLTMIDSHHDSLRANVPPELRADSMAIGRVSGPDAVGPVGVFADGKTHELSDLVWTMHNYWLHWRHTMDEPMLRDRLYPVLKASVSYVLHQLSLGADGRLHLPQAISPEYKDTAPDTNYDLSLLRWGCETLLALSQRLKLDEPLAPTWKDVLARLTPYPAGPDGLFIGRGVPLAVSHRHFSHMLMVYPLHLMTGQEPQERALIERSLAHWIGFEGALQGYSFVGASAISSLLGKGDDSLRFMNDLIGRYLKPNTMYTESGPVIETPLAGAQAVHEMLLQSWGDVLRVFPAVPAAWQDVVFENLRAEGAFLVTAVRHGGRTVRVRVESLAGEPVTLRAAIADPQITSSAKAAPAFEKVAGKSDEWRLKLGKGEWIELGAGGVAPAQRAVTPVPVEPGRSNLFGLPQAAPVK
jgi:alpha-L-fucosidase 2